MPIAVMTLSPLTDRATYQRGLQATLQVPLVSRLPHAVVAAAAGVVIAYTVESAHRSSWALIPALLYAMDLWAGYQWIQTPSSMMRAEQVIGSVIPAVVCVIAAALTEKHLSRPPRAEQPVVK